MIDWVNVAGAAFGGIALGVEAKRFLDESRHWRHGRCDLVSAKHETLVETIESGGKKTVRETSYRRLRLMNVGIAPIRLIGILYRGVTPLKGSPELFGGRELLSPGDEYSLGAIDIEDDAWMLVTYRDGSDRRFVFLQFIDLSSDPDDPLDDLGLIGLWWRTRPRTVHPKTSDDVRLDRAHPALRRIRAGRPQSQRELRCVFDAAIHLGAVEGITLSPWQLKRYQ